MPTTSELALETTLNDLANARLRDKAPGLVNYMVGFQLLDSDEDGTRAVGIFGFEIDRSFYYVPVFFLNGEVKGLYSVYSVKSDMFLPLTEDWINLLINRKSQKLGDPDSKSQNDRGVRFPDYRRLSQIPGNSAKLACDAMHQDKPVVDTISLPEGLALLGATDHWRGLLDRHPKLAAACANHYSYLDFCPAPKVAAVSERRDIVIVSGINDQGVDSLTDEQRRDVIRGGIAVSDPRPELEKSLVWTTGTELQLASPGVNGLYELLMADGTIEPTICCRLSSQDADDHISNLFVAQANKSGFVPYRKARTLTRHLVAELKSFLEEHGKSPKELAVNDTVVLVGFGGECSIPFTILGRTQGIDGFLVYRVRSQSRIIEEDAYDIEQPNHKMAASPNHYTKDGRTRFGAQAGDMTTAQGSYQDPGTMLYAPAVERICQLIVRDGTSSRMAYTDVKCVVYSEGCRAILVGRDGKQSSDKVLTLADLGTVNTMRHCTEKVAQEMKVWASGDGLINIRDVGPAKGYTKVAGLGHLIRDLGLSAHDAKEIVSGARMSPQGYWVKRAAQTQFPELNDTSDTGYMGQFTPEQQPYETSVTQPSLDNSPVYQYRSPFAGGASNLQSSPDDTLDVVARAGEVGSKEVFDAAALSSLIRAAHPTEMVERFIPTITSGMDRLGRLLFLIYWHYEEFEERFKDELPDLIDSLKASFEHVGEIVTELKARSISGDADFFGVGSN